MAVYFKFKSAKDFDSIPIDGHFISVASLKEKIFESKHLGRGTDFDLVVTNAQTHEEYLDEAMLIPKNTSVLIRRVPGQRRLPIVTAPPPIEHEEPVDIQPTNIGFPGADSSAMKFPEDLDMDEFGNDLYAIPETISYPLTIPTPDAPPSNKDDEDSKIQALIDTPALDWQRQNSDGFGRGFGRGMAGRMMGGRGFGRVGFERKTPPQGYICHRCKVPGHFIQHCPTNGDPNYDVKRVKPPTGIPKSMLMATPDGSYALPSGAVAVLKPNEAAFEKEIEGLPSSRPVGDLPPELRCPLCKEVMKDAVLTSKCCFTSYCDKCIRDHIISKSVCLCGATNILADDLLPNKTLRDTINRFLESNNSSGDNGGSAFQVQDMESRHPHPKIPSPTLSAASKGGEQILPIPKEETSKVESAEQSKVVNVPQQNPEKETAAKIPDVSVATHESVTVKEQASQGSAPLADEEVQQKPVSSEAGKKKKKKKVRMPLSAENMQWNPSQDFGVENYMMPSGPSAYNPYWNGMQHGMEGFMAPYAAAPPPPPPMHYMGYGLGPLDFPFGGVLPHDPFAAQNCMMPFVPPPPRDLASFGMGFNSGPPPAPIMSREEFEARKADLRRKREMERRGDSRDLSRDREFSREVSSSRDNPPPMKLKSRPSPQPPIADHRSYHRGSERASLERDVRDYDAPRPSSKRKSDHDDHHYDRDHRDPHHHRRSHGDHRPESSKAPPSMTAEPPPPPPTKSTSAADRKHKASVFSRISFPEGETKGGASKKRKVSSSSEIPAAATAGSHRAPSNGYREEKTASQSRKSSSSAAAAAADYESSDDDRHFKRRPSRYESSPPVSAADREEEGRHKRGSRDRDRSKHR